MTRDALLACIAALLMTGCATSPAASEPQGRVLAVDQVAGFWRLVGRYGSCELALSNLIIDGVRPVLIESCDLPAVSTARSWRATADGFELLDADGAVLLAFQRSNIDGFVSTIGGYLMSRAPVS